MDDGTTRGPRARERADVEIREMGIDDLAEVFHIGERNFTTDVPYLYRTWDEYEVTHFFTTEPDFCLVAEDRETGKIAGFALGTTFTKPRSSWKYGYLVWMAVDAPFRRMHVGDRLLTRLLERMVEEGVRIVMVDTDADNRSALKFFTDRGFERPRKHIYLSRNLDDFRRRPEREED